MLSIQYGRVGKSTFISPVSFARSVNYLNMSFAMFWLYIYQQLVRTKSSCLLIFIKADRPTPTAKVEKPTVI